MKYYKNPLMAGPMPRESYPYPASGNFSGKLFRGSIFLKPEKTGSHS
jgi:hypothetical protein